MRGRGGGGEGQGCSIPAAETREICKTHLSTFGDPGTGVFGTWFDGRVEHFLVFFPSGLGVFLILPFAASCQRRERSLRILSAVFLDGMLGVAAHYWDEDVDLKRCGGMLSPGRTERLTL